jgi:hypothetical protein
MKRAKTVSLPKGKKAPSKKTAKPIKPKPPKQDEGELNGSSLVFFKEKTPGTFQLSRSENPKDFEYLSFVIKACDKASDNPKKAIIHVEKANTGSRIVACDGLRLHAAEISKKIKAGNYKPRVTKDTITLGEPEEDIVYPKWVNNIPVKVEKRGVINLEKSGMGKDREETEKLSITFNSIVKQTGKTVNLRDLDDLVKESWTVYSSDKDGRILLRPQSNKPGEAEPEYPVAVITEMKQAT